MYYLLPIWGKSETSATNEVWISDLLKQHAHRWYAKWFQQMDDIHYHMACFNQTMRCFGSVRKLSCSIKKIGMVVAKEMKSTNTFDEPRLIFGFSCYAGRLWLWNYFSTRRESDRSCRILHDTEEVACTISSFPQQTDLLHLCFNKAKLIFLIYKAKISLKYLALSVF